MARVLVTGCAGFLGSHLCDALLKEGHRVIGVDNLVGGDVENIPEDVEFYKQDCRDTKFMDFVCKVANVVYHLAAYPHEGLSVFSPITVTRSVYDATVVTATAAIKAGVKRFVFTSSMARYGVGWGKSRLVSDEFEPFNEDMPPRPVDPYGIAKVAAEETLGVLGRTHGMEVVILVPHNVIGERQRYYDPYRNVVAIMINRCLQGKKPIIYGNGEQKRCFTYVGDVIDSFIKAGFRDNLDGQIINIGPDENPVTINQLAVLVMQLVNPERTEFDAEYVPDRPCEVKEAWCSANKARALFNYQTKTTLRESVKRMVAWIKEQGPKPFEYHLPLEIVSDKTPRTWKERMM